MWLLRISVGLLALPTGASHLTAMRHLEIIMISAAGLYWVPTMCQSSNLKHWNILCWMKQRKLKQKQINRSHINIKSVYTKDLFLGRVQVFQLWNTCLKCARLQTQSLALQKQTISIMHSEWCILVCLILMSLEWQPGSLTHRFPNCC